MRMRTGHGRGWTAAAAALVMGVCAAPWIGARPQTPAPAAAPPPAQAAPPPAPVSQIPGPSFRSGVEVVTVDVGVVDRQGAPLRDLTSDDFAVSVAGRPRRVVTAEFVERRTTASAPRPEQSPVSTNEGGGSGRLFVFAVDQHTLDIGSARRIADGAAPFFAGLTYADRSALVLLPLGPNMSFTWAHDRVQAALRQATGIGRNPSGWEYGSLADARAISNRDQMAMRMVGERECSAAGGGGSGIAGSPGTTAAGPASAGTPAGSAPAGGRGGSTSAGAGAGASGASRPSSGLDAFGTSSCARNIQMQADSAWRGTVTTSLASIASLRQFLGLLREVRGDKAVILISGGWPLDERDELSLVSQVAAEAAAARATIFSVFVPAPNYTADRPRITTTPLMDDSIHFGPLETLAGKTGGGSFRAEVGAELAFARLARELSGYYRIGVEKEPADGTASGRRMKVQVSRPGVTVRAREIFDTPVYEDRDWVARLAAAIESPILATEVGLRITSYLSADPDSSLNRRLLIAGEATRFAAGNGSLEVIVNGLDGARVAGGHVPLTNPGVDALPFSMNIAVPRGSYVVRVGLIDSAGHVGSVDHRVDVDGVPLGDLSATGPILLAVPGGAGGEPRFPIDAVRQDERLAFEVDLEGPKERLAGASVEFSIEAVAGGAPLLKASGIVAPGAREGTTVAQGVSTVRGLPPGDYVLRATISNGLDPAGDVSRRFSVIEGHAAPPAGASAPGSLARGPLIALADASRMPVLTVEPFALDQVLAPNILGPFLERVAARPDATDPDVRSLLERARTSGLSNLAVPTAVTDQAAGVFLKGLTQLSAMSLEPAAVSFRHAITIAPDFYAAMVYLGACYAAGGKDKDAAAVWRTALIREGDVPELHAMLADAYLRQGRGDLAVADLDEARERWPQDMALKRRFAVSALMGGQTADGLQAVDELLEHGIKDEPSLAVAMLTIYEAFESGTPIETPDRDRARMLRLADAYKTTGGPSQALADAWVSAVMR